MARKTAKEQETAVQQTPFLMRCKEWMGDLNFWQILLGTGVFSGVLTVVYTVFYRQNCEEFYNIPGRYFSADIQEKAFYLLLVAGMVVFPFLLGRMKRRALKRGEYNRSMRGYLAVLTTFVGLVYGAINTFGMNLFLKWFSRECFDVSWLRLWLLQEIPFLVMLFLYVAFGMVVFLYFILFDFRALDSKSRWKNRFHRVVFAAAFVVTLLTFALVNLAKLGSGPELSTRYEVFEVDGRQLAVIAVYDGNLLAVPYHVEEETAYLDTSRYRLYPAVGQELSLEEFADVLCAGEE
ncbi:MAG: hypothetical protein ACOX6U_10140 [Oscillospiraceae bacterium]|jgi:hypothetical protein